MARAARFDVSDVIERYGTTHVAERCNVSVRTVQRWVHNGVDVWTADLVATKVLGSHPAFVWGRSWRDA